MSEQVWNFHAIEGGASDILGAVSTTQGLLDEGKASLATLTTSWTGDSASAYDAVQQRWDSTALELNSALQNLARAVSEAGSTMAHTESSVTGMFS